jgi:Rad51 protein
LKFEVDGRDYHMAYGTFRNKISAMLDAGEIEVAYYSTQAFYTLKGVTFTKPMTVDHTGVSLLQRHMRQIKNNPVYRLIQNLPFDKNAVHDIRLRVVPLGGNVMSYASTYRIHLDGRYPDCRRARLELSPCHPQADILFAIDERGFTDVGDDKTYSISRPMI